MSKWFIPCLGFCVCVQHVLIQSFLQVFHVFGGYLKSHISILMFRNIGHENLKKNEESEEDLFHKNSTFCGFCYS
ncbi:hypothetical protein F383_10579 [Gossypium arboreum]|uniref:Uncharacterized protein n=1 Tax=Gossypium arboreum TaxID=29729 RepID=A0A0B0NP37_GOSAR|nr:hypothetical protein F383_10579 [Gossypium arboreum]